MRIETILSADEVRRVEAKIAAVEAMTSAELRVVITRSSWMGIRPRARALFRKYGLDRTRERNGVMILVDLRNRELLLYGDEAVDSRLGQDFWDDLRDVMVTELSAGRLADSLCLGLRRIGERLAADFPPRPDDTNEIANTLIFER